MFAHEGIHKKPMEAYQENPDDKIPRMYMLRILRVFLWCWWFDPPFFKDPINEQIERQHGEIIEEILQWYGEETPVPSPITTPDSNGIVRHNRCGSQKVVEDNKRNHGNTDVQPIVPRLQDVGKPPDGNEEEKRTRHECKNRIILMIEDQTSDDEQDD